MIAGNRGRRPTRFQLLPWALIAAVMLTPSRALAATTWQRVFSTTASDHVGGFAADGLGGSFVVGDKYRRIPAEARIAKLDADGTIVWSRLGQSGDGWGTTVVSLPDGGCLVGGVVASPTPRWEHMAWLARFDAGGAITWERAWGSGRTVPDAWFDQLGVLESGDLVAVVTWGTIPGGQASLFRLTPDGIVTWNADMGAGTTNRLYGIHGTTDRGFVVAGAMYLDGGLDADGWIAKFDSLNRIEWERIYQGANDQHLLSIIERPGGGYFACGSSSDPTLGTATPWFLAVSEAGTIDAQWRLALPGQFRDLATTPDGGAILVGFTEDTAFSGCIVKVDSAGRLEWALRQMSHASAFLEVDAAGDGGYLLAGQAVLGAGWDTLIVKMDASAAVADGCWLMDLFADTLVPTPYWSTNVASLALPAEFILDDNLSTPLLAETLRVVPWCVPDEVMGVRVTRAATAVNLSWDVEPASETYEVYRGAIAAFDAAAYDHGDVGACGLTATSATDIVGVDGANYYYLVIGRNSAGRGPYGTRTDGQSRPPAVAECP